MTKLEFNQARLAFLDHLRREARLTPAARLIGLEIGAYLNSTSGEHETIVKTLGVGVGTVKCAIQELATYRYYEVERRPLRNGRKNFYRALFNEVGTNLGPASPSTLATNAGGKRTNSRPG